MRRTLGPLALALLASTAGCGSSSFEDAQDAGTSPQPDGGADGDAAPEGDASPDASPEAGEAGACDGGAPLVDDAGEPIDPTSWSTVSKACAYKCPLTNCDEAMSGYQCQNLGAWGAIPHADACGCGEPVLPAVVAGKCTATAPAGEAVKYAGADPDHAGVRILPDGRRIHPAGALHIFDDAGLVGTQTVAATAVPGTTFAVTVSAGYGSHVVRVIDTTKLDGTTDPTVSKVEFAKPFELSWSVAFVPPGRVFVATAKGVVQALTLDVATGALARDDASSISLPPSTGGLSGNAEPWYAAAIAVSPDGKVLVVASVVEKSALVYSLEDGASYGTLLATVNVAGDQAFDVAFDPNDPTGRFAYVSQWNSHRVAEIDLADPTKASVSRTFTVERAPSGITFLDARWLVVANGLSDSISLIDRTTGTVTTTPADVAPVTGGGFTPARTLFGLEPSNLAWDATTKTLWASLAGENAVAAWRVDTSLATPTLTPKGRLGTAWWPASVVLLPGGDLLVPSIRGISATTTVDVAGFGGNVGDAQRGGVQRIPAPSDMDLEAGAAEVDANDSVGTLAGYPAVTCPEGVAGSGDFPVPSLPGVASPAIEHIFFVVRENKDFDGVLGDWPGANGDPTQMLKPAPGDAAKVWPNLRALAAGFTLFDNYYTDAEFSTQGHVWTTFGRAVDFDERTWFLDARSVPLAGIAEAGRPVEGSLFEWLEANQVDYDVLGEIEGTSSTPVTGRNPVDPKYPGGPFQNILYPDTEKACYIAGRARVRCDLTKFVYATISNDHTSGVGSNKPTPETYVSVNDEATGMLVDAISHSKYWPKALIVITEDDPQDGGDHVDGHRTPMVMISPWVKRGYLSKTHIDVASLHKTFAHILGKPYLNRHVAEAGIPFDAFTSTPDYTPYDRKARQWVASCGGKSAPRAEERLSATWDFADADEQPGLSAQVARWMRGRPLQKLPPTLEAEVARREARAARPAAHDAD